MDIIKFCEIFDDIDSEAIICVSFLDDKYDMNIKCYKKNIYIWSVLEIGLGFSIQETEINFEGCIHDAYTVIKENSFEYCICNKLDQPLIYFTII